MKKQFLTLTIAVFTAVVTQAKALTCHETILEKKAMSAALTLEKLNGGGSPLTTEIYSLSSQYNAYVVILSHSGIQNYWKVVVDSDRCLIKLIEMQ